MRFIPTNDQVQRLSSAVLAGLFNVAPRRGSLAARKAKQARNRQNRLTRAMLYQERGRIAPSEWHTRLNALSLGTAS